MSSSAEMFPAETLPPETEALRTRVAWTRLDGVRVLAVRGDDARAALLHLLPSPLHLRDAQVRESLLLDAAGRPLADVLVCADDEDYLLLVEGLDADALEDHVRENLPAGVEPELEPLSDRYEIVSLHGPWAWELIAEVLGADLMALPYLNFFRIDEGYCVRAGKTGEFGYDVVVERHRADSLVEKLEAAGREYGLVRASAETLSLARFEGWFFDPAFVPEGATPVELQLQWRLDPNRSWLGKEAVDARRASPDRQRLTCLSADGELAPGDVVLAGEQPIGRVVRAAFSPLRGEWIASALLDVAWAHGGIDRYHAEHASGAPRSDATRVRTMVPPLVDNRSLHVDPRRHTYRTSDELTFGPLARPWRPSRGA